MPEHLPQSKQRTKQIKDHNKKALAENRPDDVLPENSTTRIWEPHEWNAEIARRAKARGEVPNIARPPMGRGFVHTTEEPEQVDLNRQAQEKAIQRREGTRKPLKGLSVEKPD